MNSPFFIRHFGMLTILPIYIFFMVFNFLGIKISYNQYTIDWLNQATGYSQIDVRYIVLYINFIGWLLTTTCYLLLTKIYYTKLRKRWLITFVPFTLIIQFFMTSTLRDFLEMEDEFVFNPEASALLWVIALPAMIVLLLFKGWLFDRIKNS